jgi:hypothetical protein
MNPQTERLWKILCWIVTFLYATSLGILLLPYTLVLLEP